MREKKEVDMLHGPLLGKIVMFSIPIAISAFLQQMFNAADTAVVGRFAGSEPLAAVGANAFIISLMVILFMGLATGTNVVVAGYHGQRDDDAVSKAIHTSLALALLIGVILAVIGIFIGPWAHAAIGTGEAGSALRAQAILYFRIYFLGMPFIMLYNFESAVLRSKGDTRRPLVVLILSGFLNIVLNLLLVVVFHMTVEGVAIATLMSNAFSAIVLLVILHRETDAFHVSLRKLRIHRRMLKNIIRIGLPAGVQGSMFSLANVLLQSSINALGPVVIAGSTVGMNAEVFAYDVVQGFSQAATTFVGQNYAVGNIKRCRRINLICFAIGTAGTFLLAVLMTIFRTPFVSIFTKDPAVIEVACQRVLYVAMFQCLNGASELLSGTMRGMRRSFLPALISIFTICGVRLIWLFAFYPSDKNYIHLIFAYPLSWAFYLGAMAVAYLITMRQVKKEVLTV